MSFTRRQSELLARCKARLRSAELAATGEQFYLIEYERFTVTAALAELDDRPPPIEVDDENEVIDHLVSDDDEV